MLELGSILILGIFAQWAAWKVKLPAILPLIIIGLFVGPVSEMIFGHKFIDPSELFAGKTMFYFVSLSVGIILFEGGLTLKFKEMRELAGTVRNMIISGSIIMTIGAALIAWLVLDMDYRLALMFGSLMIVTGPTVIAPILKSVKPNKNVAAILKWEGILIDAVGAFVAVLIYELFFVASMAHGASGSITMLALQTFFMTVAAGAIGGFAFGGLLYWILKKEWVPESLLEVVSLAFVVLAFAASDALVHESGLLAVTVMGVLLANLDTPKMKRIIHFKENITVLLISILFIILSATITIKNITDLQERMVPVAIIFTVVVFVLRPLVIFVSSRKSNLNFKEKIFISWIGPKGIVAAAVAALFSLYLKDKEHLQMPEHMYDQVELLVPLTFAIILGTVTLNGLFAKPVAKLLDVIRKPSRGILITGANPFGVVLANYLQKVKIPVMLIDSSDRNVNYARSAGLRAIRENILSEDIEELLETEDVGRLVSLTSANDVNIFACEKFIDIFGAENVHRLITPNEAEMTDTAVNRSVLFARDAEFPALNALAKKHKVIEEMEITSNEQLQMLLKNDTDKLIPLLIRSSDDKVTLIDVSYDFVYVEGDRLAYIGVYDPEEAKSEEISE